jgi:hypothetical protein
MKVTTLVLSIAALLTAPMVGAQVLQTVYSHDFDTPVGPEWSHNTRTTTPNQVRTFLGRFSADNVQLDLYDLPEHCAVTVTFELLVIGEWEGSVGWGAGPDVWDLNVAVPSDCCPSDNLLHTTFATCSCRMQAYPDTHPNQLSPGFTGAEEIDTLGYSHDSVYDMSFTFYHHQSDLRLSFAGSPLLQGVLDESWGIDNIEVAIDAESCCRAVRKLPEVYGGGTSVPVSIDVVPNPGTQAIVLVETPPNGWPVFDVTEGGAVNPTTGGIRFGPYFGDSPRTIEYKVAIPSAVTSPINFVGSIAVDDDVPESICGDSHVMPAGSHPADVNRDFIIKGDEFTAYAAAWRTGDPWPIEPATIPATYVSNAGIIWKMGESYVFDATQSPPWRPANPPKAVTGHAHATTSRLEDGGIEISIEVAPEDGTLAYLVEDVLPAGWLVRAMTDGAYYDAAAQVIRFGPYFDDVPRTLTYVVDAPTGSLRSTFGGWASFNEQSIQITGDRALWPRQENAPAARTQAVD